MMISYLAHNQLEVAKDLYRLWQRSYPMEAKLIGVGDFLPLNRTLSKFQLSDTRFIGIKQDGKILSALEFKCDDLFLDIHSLVVDPDHFRRGYGKKLMEYVLENVDWNSAEVETGSANIPAIGLYEKLGFIIYEEYVAEMGISKVKMKKDLAKS